MNDLLKKDSVIYLVHSYPNAIFYKVKVVDSTEDQCKIKTLGMYFLKENNSIIELDMRCRKKIPEEYTYNEVNKTLSNPTDRIYPGVFNYYKTEDEAKAKINEMMNESLISLFSRELDQVKTRLNRADKLIDQVSNDIEIQDMNNLLVKINEIDSLIRKINNKIINNRIYLMNDDKFREEINRISD